MTSNEDAVTNLLSELLKSNQPGTMRLKRRLQQILAVPTAIGDAVLHALYDRYEYIIKTINFEEEYLNRFKRQERPSSTPVIDWCSQKTEWFNTYPNRCRCTRDDHNAMAYLFSKDRELCLKWDKTVQNMQSHNNPNIITNRKFDNKSRFQGATFNQILYHAGDWDRY